MHSCSKDSLFPSQTFCGRQRKAGVGLVAPGLRFFWCCYTPNLRCLLKTQLITPPIHFPNELLLQRSKSFQKMDPKLCFVRGTPKTHLGGSEGAAVSGVGKETLSILLQCPKWSCSTPGAVLGSLALAGSGLCASLPFKLDRTVTFTGS